MTDYIKSLESRIEELESNLEDAYNKIEKIKEGKYGNPIIYKKWKVIGLDRVEHEVEGRRRMDILVTLQRTYSIFGFFKNTVARKIYFGSSFKHSLDATSDLGLFSCLFTSLRDIIDVIIDKCVEEGYLQFEEETGRPTLKYRYEQYIVTDKWRTRV